jgi:hypothetical protein
MSKKSKSKKDVRAEQGPAGAAPRLASHPRAQRHIRQAKGWGGLVGLVLATLASMRGGVAPLDTGAHALVGGIAGYLVAWFVAVNIWRQLAVAELRAAHKRLVEAQAGEDLDRAAKAS